MGNCSNGFMCRCIQVAIGVDTKARPHGLQHVLRLGTPNRSCLRALGLPPAPFFDDHLLAPITLFELKVVVAIYRQCYLYFLYFLRCWVPSVP
jgi:hypothetical protein